MDDRHPNTVAELMHEAGMALATRDPERLEELERIAEGWLQSAAETEALGTALRAMAEAAEMLLDEPSGLAFATD